LLDSYSRAISDYAAAHRRGERDAPARHHPRRWTMRRGVRA